VTEADGGVGRRKRGGAAAEIATLASRVGADEALEALVGQFADPLAFLRELVQNSLDAASTSIDVDFAFDEEAGDKKKTGAKKSRQDRGLAKISVVDNGEGMNEGIIDRYLLTLFSSTKENDLTKIGKFGVGFVSIFAIEPELVVLETGQSGEAWRILFHPDRRYEKLRLDEPVEGTEITLYKRTTRAEFFDLRTRGQKTVRHWCKYAEADIRVDGDKIGEEFAVESSLSIAYEEPGTSLVVGFPPIGHAATETLSAATTDAAGKALNACIGMYNRGLTLVEGDALPGESASELIGLSVRVKSRYLEHTLTRDNVRRDENYDKAVALVRARVKDTLRPKLVAHLEALARHASSPEEIEDPGPPSLDECLVYARLPSMQLHQTAYSARLFPTVTGEPVSLQRLRARKTHIGAVFSAPEPNPTSELLGHEKIAVVLDRGLIVAYLRLCEFDVVAADSVYFTATPAEASSEERALLDDVDRLLDRVKGKARGVTVGDIDYARSPVAGRLFVRQEKAFELTELGEGEQLGLFGGARQVVLARRHPLVEACLRLAVRARPLAAQLLAQAVAVAEGRDRDRIAGLTVEVLGWPADAAEREREGEGK